MKNSILILILFISALVGAQDCGELTLLQPLSYTPWEGSTTGSGYVESSISILLRSEISYTSIVDGSEISYTTQKECPDTIYTGLQYRVDDGQNIQTRLRYQLYGYVKEYDDFYTYANVAAPESTECIELNVNQTLDRSGQPSIILHNGGCDEKDDDNGDQFIIEQGVVDPTSLIGVSLSGNIVTIDDDPVWSFRVDGSPILKRNNTGFRIDFRIK